MLPAFILKKAVDVAIKAIAKKHKLNKLQKYVEEDNELDIQVKQMQKTISKQGKTQEENQKEIAFLKSSSHAPQEYVCCKKCGCKITKIKNK